MSAAKAAPERKVPGAGDPRERALAGLGGGAAPSTVRAATLLVVPPPLLLLVWPPSARPRCPRSSASAASAEPRALLGPRQLTTRLAPPLIAHRDHVERMIGEDDDVEAPMAKLERDPRVTLASALSCGGPASDQAAAALSACLDARSPAGRRPPIQTQVDRYPGRAFRRFAARPGRHRHDPHRQKALPVEVDHGLAPIGIGHLEVIDIRAFPGGLPYQLNLVLLRCGSTSAPCGSARRR